MWEPLALAVALAGLGLAGRLLKGHDGRLTQLVAWASSFLITVGRPRSLLMTVSKAAFCWAFDLARGPSLRFTRPLGKSCSMRNESGIHGFAARAE